MRQAIVKKGKVYCEETPAPVVSPGNVLIKVVNSCISAGTEMSGVGASGKSLIRKALEQPEKIKRLLDMVRSEGVARVYQQIKGKLDSGTPTGYSISGVVIGVGKGAARFQVGDPVAAAGAGFANHAEYVEVPENLIVKLPHGLGFPEASTMTLGGIALQGVRRCDLRLGEYCAVIGTGILGLLSVQMLRLSGVRVIAIDIDDGRLCLAKEMGAEAVVNPAKEDPVKAVENVTRGQGADAILFAAATQNSETLSSAFKMCKKKGRVVMVGVSGMAIKREDIYPKELDLMVSTSYGPGRYDRNYEEKGIDYPYAYVRWTENRNLEEYLRLLHSGAIKLDKLISSVFPISQAGEAFEALSKGDTRPLMVLLDYGLPETEKLAAYAAHKREILVNSAPISRRYVNLALIGAGNFATAVHLPNIRELSDMYRLYAVVDQAGNRAKDIAQQYGATIATTDYDAVLGDPNVDAVLICTRHGNHAELALKALKAGKHVFVEKPLSSTKSGLDEIARFYGEAPASKPVLTVGFNRRFSRYAGEIKRHLDSRISPVFIQYRMNSGYIPYDNWVHEDGGRIVGEACHIVDLIGYLVGAEVKSVTVESLSPGKGKFKADDNRAIVLKYSDGSLGVIEYFSIGNKDFPKEYMEVHFDEKTIVLDDYRALQGFGLKVNELVSAMADKGHKEELIAFYKALTGDKGVWPIPISSLIETTDISLCVSE